MKERKSIGGHKTKKSSLNSSSSEKHNKDFTVFTSTGTILLSLFVLVNYQIKYKIIYPWIKGYNSIK